MKLPRSLYLSIALISFTAIAIGIFYYQNENSKVDQRVVKARELYSNYNNLAEKQDFAGLLLLLDSIKQIYNTHPHYSESYEISVVENNISALYITLALFKDSLNQMLIPDSMKAFSKEDFLNLAYIHADKSCSGYLKWKDCFGPLTEDEIQKHIEKEFFIGLPIGLDSMKLLQKRTKEILDAKTEIDRRISVVMTNLGVIERHRGNYQSAAHLYEQALVLWDKNLDAENNLNILLGKPLRKRGFIEKLFPSKRL